MYHHYTISYQYISYPYNILISMFHSYLLQPSLLNWMFNRWNDFIYNRDKKISLNATTYRKSMVQNKLSIEINCYLSIITWRLAGKFIGWLRWNVNKWGSFFNSPHPFVVHTLLSSVSVVWNHWSKKRIQQQIWFHHMNFSTHPHIKQE